MNDSELNSQLKRVPIPARTPDYWENFPSRVGSQIVETHRSPAGRPAVPLPSFFQQSLRTCAFALVLLVFTLAFGAAFHVILKKEKAFRQEIAALPNHLRVFMADEHGMHRLIADQP